MAIINAEGLFNGERLRRCSNLARLYWPYLYAASNGYARLELDYKRILARAFYSFEPWPTEPEIIGYLDEYVRNFLLFVWQPVGARWWGIWDTPSHLLPKHKTAADNMSPAPPAELYTRWRKAISAKACTYVGGTLRPSLVPMFGNPGQLFESIGLPNYFGNFSEMFRADAHGIGIGIGIGENHSPSNPDGGFSFTPPEPERDAAPAQGELIPGLVRPGPSLSELQDTWFDNEFWPLAWRKEDKPEARKAFRRHAHTEKLKIAIVAALNEQRPLMLERQPEHRPYMATWINKQRYQDTNEQSPPAALKRRPTAGERAVMALYEEEVK